MLALTRRVGETIRINDDISVKVLGVEGRQVMLEIEAPEHIVVQCEGSHKRIKAKKCETEAV